VIRTQSKPDIINAMKTAEHPAALVRAGEIDAGNFSRDYPNAFGNPDRKN
jgi:hypothetical protein